MKRSLKGLFLLLALISVAAGLGCASPDPENRAERPWNAPQNWEFGLPPQMMEGR